MRSVLLLVVLPLAACARQDAELAFPVEVEQTETRQAPSPVVEQPTSVSNGAELHIDDSAALLFVRDFYDAYTPRGIAGGLLVLDGLLVERPELFTPQLLVALKRDAAERSAASGYIAGLDFDPFLNSQDPCERYEAATARRNGQTVLVDIYAICEGVRGSTPDLVVEVTASGTSWGFVDFYYDEEMRSLMQVLRDLHP
jgi:hypothetical protein